jgi:hypothetical protein
MKMIRAYKVVQIRGKERRWYPLIGRGKGDYFPRSSPYRYRVKKVFHTDWPCAAFETLDQALGWCLVIGRPWNAIIIRCLVTLRYPKGRREYPDSWTGGKKPYPECLPKGSLLCKKIIPLSAVRSASGKKIDMSKWPSWIVRKEEKE